MHHCVFIIILHVIVLINSHKSDDGQKTRRTPASSHDERGCAMSTDDGDAELDNPIDQGSRPAANPTSDSTGLDERIQALEWNVERLSETVVQLAKALGQEPDLLAVQLPPLPMLPTTAPAFNAEPVAPGPVGVTEPLPIAAASSVVEPEVDAESWPKTALPAAPVNAIGPAPLPSLSTYRALRSSVNGEFAPVPPARQVRTGFSAADIERMVSGAGLAWAGGLGWCSGRCSFSGWRSTVGGSDRRPG